MPGRYEAVETDVDETSGIYVLGDFRSVDRSALHGPVLVGRHSRIVLSDDRPRLSKHEMPFACETVSHSDSWVELSGYVADMSSYFSCSCTRVATFALLSYHGADTETAVRACLANDWLAEPGLPTWSYVAWMANVVWHVLGRPLMTEAHPHFDTSWAIPLLSQGHLLCVTFGAHCGIGDWSWDRAHMVAMALGDDGVICVDTSGSRVLADDDLSVLNRQAREGFEHKWVGHAMGCIVCG